MKKFLEEETGIKGIVLLMNDKSNKPVIKYFLTKDTNDYAPYFYLTISDNPVFMVDDRNFDIEWDINIESKLRSWIKNNKDELLSLSKSMLITV